MGVEFFRTTEGNFELGAPWRPKLTDISEHSRGMDDAPAGHMTPQPIAELDDRVIAMSHCSNWRGGERLYEWLRTKLRSGVSFSLNDPFRLRRVISHTAAVPFVP